MSFIELFRAGECAAHCARFFSERSSIRPESVKTERGESNTLVYGETNNSVVRWGQIVLPYDRQQVFR